MFVCGIISFFSFTFASEAVNVKVCVLHTHHLPTTNLPTALTHDGWISTAGDGRAAAAVSSIEARLVLNCWQRKEERQGWKSMLLVIFLSQLLHSLKMTRF